MKDERWLEMDIYWFQGGVLETKVRELFERVEPLWQGAPDARHGITLCVGWLYDSVMYWNGHLDALIPTCQPPTYEAWTYRRLRDLVSALKREAERRGIANFHVGLIILGGSTMAYSVDATCQGWGGRTEERAEKAHYNVHGRWFREHPEIDGATYGVFSYASKVNVPADEAVCRLPHPTFGEYFADKLCDMARHVGFNAVVLRDAIFSPAYVRGNRRRYMDPQARDRLNDSFISTFARIKAQLPEFVIIGYSSGTSSVEEWRSHGFDLERVAKSGYLDVWITQTWASAWQDYWPAHSMGYTFQLSNVLVNLAMLADTPCKHVFLVETFDAWEPWDSIHQYPSKVAWEIWAYSHASVRLPGESVRRPDGCYISWMNQGYRLIPESTVALLRDTFAACADDLAREPIPGGPCLVYNRKAMESLLDRPESFSRGEEIDDWAAMLQKYGVQILSITRSEWLDQIDADALVIPAPLGIDSATAHLLLERIRGGTPVLFTGQAGLIPDQLRASLDIAVCESPVLGELPSAAVVEPELARTIGAAGLSINQRQRTLAGSGNWQSLISCLGGPVFSRHLSLPVYIWETPEWGTPRALHLSIESIQSPQTYNAVAQTINRYGWGSEGIKWTNDDWTKPCCFLFWRYTSGEVGILLANLETGLTGNSQFAIRGSLTQVSGTQTELTRSPRSDNRLVGRLRSKPGFAPGLIKDSEEGVTIALPPHKACLLYLDK